MLNTELILGAHAGDFKRYFVVFQCDDFMSRKSLFKGQLITAGAVESQEASWEKDRVLEVPLHLLLRIVTDEALKVLIAYDHTTRECLVGEITRQNYLRC